MPELVLEFTVLGEAKTAGSKKAFRHPHTGRIIVTDDTGAKGRTWREDVRGAALRALETGDGPFPRLPEPLDGALEVDITFYRARPKGHYGSGKNSKFVKDSAPAHPTTLPDVDKLSRAVLDALKKVVWTDDARIVTKTARKRYADNDATQIKVFLADEQTALDLPVDARVRGHRAFREPGQPTLLDAA